MSIGSPATAPPRTDLPYLRHRVRALQPQLTTPVVPSVVSALLTPPAAIPAPLVTPPPAIAVSSSLDLDAPRVAPTVTPASAPAVAPVAPVAPAGPVAAPAREAAAAAYVPVRGRPAAPLVLTPKAPSMSLTRIQSGVGALTIEAACGASVGDVRLGCAYRLRSGFSGVVQRATGASAGPPGAARPLITARRGQFETLAIDLLQSRDLDRLVVYGYSESNVALNWGGTLVTTTFGGTMVELPLGRPASAGVGVFMSIYNVAGEFVLRAEMEQIDGSIRDACTAFGFDQIAWVDDRTPLV